MADYDKDQIKKMEDEFLKLQKIEIAIDSPKSKTSKLINSAAMSVKTYAKKENIDELIEEAETIIRLIGDTGHTRGKIMSLKTMEKYLDDSEKSDRKERILDMIDRQNSKRAQARMEMYVDELAKDANILRDDIKLFRMRGRIAGLTNKEINKQLVRAAMNNASPVDAFGRRFKTLEKAVLRREASATEIDEYRKNAKINEKWQWITISAKPCPDCRIRAGVILSYNDWRKKGTPGSGNTICRASCMCKLIPVSVAEDLFPVVKQFDWNKDDGILTPGKDIRTFGAKAQRKK